MISLTVGNQVKHELLNSMKLNLSISLLYFKCASAKGRAKLVMLGSTLPTERMETQKGDKRSGSPATTRKNEEGTIS
jgi:hypothetical protein